MCRNMKTGMYIVYSSIYELHMKCRLQIFNYKLLLQFGYLKLCMADTFNTDKIDIGMGIRSSAK